MSSVTKNDTKAVMVQQAAELMPTLMSDQRVVEYLRANLEPILEKLVEQAKDGNLVAIKDVLDRVYGKARERVQVESDVVYHVNINVVDD